MSFLDIVSKFNQQADSHSKSQSLNPFSEQFEQSRSPSPRFSREDYGKPVAGSKTDLRGRKAKSHICREILELCTVIHDVGTYNAKKRNSDDDDDNEEDDGTIIVSFGELFQIYTKISDKVVGLLIAAKRRGFVYFDREILFQRRDDDVLIALLKPISEISKILKDDISQANTPSAPVEPTPVEKKKSSSKTKRAKPECNNEQTQQIDSCTTTVDQTNVILEVNGDAVVEVVNNERNDDREKKCDEKINDGGVVEEITIDSGVVEEITIDSEENGIDNANRTDEINSGEAPVEIEIGNGETGGDNEICSSEQVDGVAAVEIQINGQENADDEIKGNEEVTATVVEEEVVVNDVSEVSEANIAVESIQNTVADVNHDDKGVIDEEFKTMDVNDLNEVVEDKNENIDSADGKDAGETIENVQGENYANDNKVNMTNGSIEVGSSDSVGSINGEIEHIIPFSDD